MKFYMLTYLKILSIYSVKIGSRNEHDSIFIICKLFAFFAILRYTYLL